MDFYHGTDVETARRLLAGQALDVDEATARKIDGAAGFYLARDIGDAEFFAARRSPGAVVAYDIPTDAFDEMIRAGARYQPIPRSAISPWFGGQELFVPPAAFDTFNRFLRDARIATKPT